VVFTAPSGTLGATDFPSRSSTFAEEFSMISVLYAAKGGSGTTVLAASIGATARKPTLLVDLDGDLPGALGLPERDAPGVIDWLRSDAPATRLRDLELDGGEGLRVLPRGRPGAAPPDRWGALAAALVADGREVVVDAGTAEPPVDLVAVADRTLIVCRACYLGLRDAQRARTRPTGVVLVHEPGRALGRADVESSVGAPIVATVLLDPGIARAVDAGLLSGSFPGGLRRALRWAA
jgi:hypothetical protein